MNGSTRAPVKALLMQFASEPLTPLTLTLFMLPSDWNVTVARGVASLPTHARAAGMLGLSARCTAASEGR